MLVLLFTYKSITYLEIIYFCMLNGECWYCCTPNTAVIPGYRCMVDC